MIKRKSSFKDKLLDSLLKVKILSNKKFVKNITNKVIAFGITPYSITDNIKKIKRDDTTEEIIYQNWLIQNPVFKKFLKEQKMNNKKFYNTLTENNIIFQILELSFTSLKQELVQLNELPVNNEALRSTQIFPFIHQLIEYRINSLFPESKYSIITVPSANESIKFKDGFIVIDPTIFDIVVLDNNKPNAAGTILLSKLIVFEGVLQIAFSTTERKLSKMEYNLVLESMQSIKDKKIDKEKTIELFKKSGTYLREDDKYFYFKNINAELNADEILSNNEEIINFVENLPKNQMLYMCTSIEGIDTSIPFTNEGELLMPELVVQFE